MKLQAMLASAVIVCSVLTGCQPKTDVVMQNNNVRVEQTAFKHRVTIKDKQTGETFSYTKKLPKKGKEGRHTVDDSETIETENLRIENAGKTIIIYDKVENKKYYL